MIAQCSEDARLVPRRLRKNGVQRHDERLRELLRKREDVLAVLAAEDAVLVFEEHDVDVASSENTRSAHVVTARCL